VRATGSGMGCPDWPKCFGEYIPPTSADQLPDNYKDIFLTERLKKAERFAALLNKIGFQDKAEEILAFDKLQEAHEFNAAKAYTEYVNRLLGALTGFVVLFCFIASFFIRKEHKRVFIFTLLGFLAVILNALLGAVVVHANLLGGIVTTHFLAAFAAIAFFMMARFEIIELQITQDVEQKLKRVSVFVMLLLIIQIYFGTQVREAYDIMEAQGKVLNTETISELGSSFNVHRTLALISLLLGFLQFKLVKRSKNKDSKVEKLAISFLALTLIQIVFGSMIIMTDLSAFSKLFHISIGAALFIIQFYICTLFWRAKTIVN
jgi:cytochrome c oxidase assembly protein subunit 15